ncbi:MAG: hypothetical protein WKF96_19445, partial [Solirubrobacteraceae bacterium]
YQDNLKRIKRFFYYEWHGPAARFETTRVPESLREGFAVCAGRPRCLWRRAGDGFGHSFDRAP